MSRRMISLIRNLILKSFCICTAIGLVSCSNGTLPELDIQSVSIYTEPDANQNSATAVDLVIIYDEELVKIIAQMSAAKYFGSSRQLLMDNPTLLEIWRWELVPGQVVQGFQPPQEEGPAFAAFVFANYLSPGDHRIKVPPSGIVKVVLMRNDLKNLAVLDLHDARMGTTMSNAVSTRDWDLVRGQDLCQIRYGPIDSCRQPCNRMIPNQTPMVPQGADCAPSSRPCNRMIPRATPRVQQDMGCAPNYTPCQRKPIVTRPLCPPPALSRQPCRR